MRGRGPLRLGLLAVALAASTFLVVGAFNPAPHTGGDNAGYVALADALLSGEGYVDAYDPAGAPHTKYPPLFPVLLALAVSLGATTWTALKGWIAGVTVLSVGVTYMWADRRLESHWGGLAVALLVAASAGVVYYSHWVLSDPLFVLLTIGALWALERADGESWNRGWLVTGMAAALGAYLTRSAGLPLLAAVLGWLLLRRRYRDFAGGVAGFAVPVLAWTLRGRGEGVGDYATEFWLADPYQPALGTIGLGGLLARAVDNAVAYGTSHLPTAVVGAQGAWITLLGLALVIGAVWGWVVRVRRGPGVAELFFPAYAGLILLWPEVWGGDRFVLPLLPLVFAYGSDALRSVFSAAPAVGRGVAAVGFVALLLPALGSWTRAASEARACAAVVRTAGAYGCYGPRVGAFAEAAAWAGASLPPGSAVMTRKPRIFYLLSGIPSRTFPFDPSPEAQLALAEAVGARYVLLDQWDGQALRYLGTAVQADPGAFCFVRGFGSRSGGAQLLGILPAGVRATSGSGDEDGVRLAPCSAEEFGFRAVDAVAGYAPSDPLEIRLLSAPAP